MLTIFLIASFPTFFKADKEYLNDNVCSFCSIKNSEPLLLIQGGRIEIPNLLKSLTKTDNLSVLLYSIVIIAAKNSCGKLHFIHAV